MEETINEKKRARDDSVEESEIDSPEAKRIRENLLDILDDSEVIVDRNIQVEEDLDSVMKSFAEEISVVPVSSDSGESGESQPELGYLLEASDDELGLPPAVTEDEQKKVNGTNDDMLRVSSEAVGLDQQIWGFDDEISCYEFGIGDIKESNNGEFSWDEFVGSPDVFCGQQMDFSDLSWRHESLPAL